jgi:threonine dehydrogenase-like Zn-dependent dehydrogenase
MVACYDLDTTRVRHAAVHADVTGSSSEQIRPVLMDATEALGADAVIDAVGIEATWTQALALVRPGGTVCEIGLGQASGHAPVGKLVLD